MKYFKIQNKGLLDPRLLSLMGGTTKSDDAYKIGQWGSGLKYSLAWLIKNNVSFKIFVGEEEVKIGIIKENISNSDFEIITVNGERTSVTTHMGGDDWTAWMIIRELWCNALDEGGEVKEQTREVKGEVGTTTFFVQIIPEIKDVLDNWGEYFVHDVEPMFSNDKVSIYHGSKDLKIYKQGVLIHKIEGKRSLFNYDIKDADINELREFRGSVNQAIVQSLMNANQKVVSYFYETIDENFYEGSDSMDWEWFRSFSDIWKDTLGGSKLVNTKMKKTLIERGILTSLDKYITVPDKVYKFLTRQFTGIGALAAADKFDYFITENEGVTERLKQTFAILEVCGYNVKKELSWSIGMFTDEAVLATIDKEKKLVVVSEKMGSRGLFDMVGMVIEENEHYITGHPDCSREFQQNFINLYVTTLLKANEIEL